MKPKADVFVASSKIDDAVNNMAKVLIHYLEPEQVNALTKTWRKQSVSAKMLQQSILEVTQRYPKLRPYKSQLRRQLWAAMQEGNTQLASLAEPPIDYPIKPQKASPPEPHDLNKAQPPIAKVEMGYRGAFYAIIEGVMMQLSAPDKRNFIHSMHQHVASDEVSRSKQLNISLFLESQRPEVPNEAKFLNHLLQLMYLSLCQEFGPVKADDLLYQSHHTVKQQYDADILAALF